MNDKLQEICEHKRQEIEKGKLDRPFSECHKAARAQTPPRGFAQAIEKTIARHHPALITEIKKGSPSAGLIRADFDVPTLAKAYQAGGATCLSVLTDEAFFMGSNEHFLAARAASSLPMLRKDFMLDTWQIAESRAMGADCVLLIMAALDDEEAKELYDAATHYGMDVLIETHDEREIERALKLPTGLIGINNRSLKTMTVDLTTTIKLLPHVPKERRVVSESGIRTGHDIRTLWDAGARAYLIGEQLMRQENVEIATRTFFNPL